MGGVGVGARVRCGTRVGGGARVGCGAMLEVCVVLQ